MKRSVMVLVVVSALVGGATELNRATTARRDPSPASTAPITAAGDATPTEAVVARLGGMPVTFVGNEGRWDPRVAWVASGPDATAYFVEGGVRWALPGLGGETGWVLDQSLMGARQAVPTASRRGAGVVSYLFADAHPSLPTAAELTVDDAWPGIDVVWSGTGGRIEATYLLEPGADPSRVRVSWHGSDALSVTGDGRLSVSTRRAASRRSPRRPSSWWTAGGYLSRWRSSWTGRTATGSASAPTTPHRSW